MRIFLILIILSCSAFPFNNPREVVENHLKYLQKDSYDPTQSAKSLSRIDSKADYKKLAIRLKKFYDSKGLFVRIKRISDDKNYTDTITGEPILRLFADYPEIYVEKVNGEWKYSKETVENINKLYREIFPPGLKDLLSNLPHAFFTKIAGLEIWKWLGVLLFAILSFLFYVILNKLVINYSFRILKRVNKGKKLQYFIERVSKPLTFLIIVSLLKSFFPYLQLPLKLANNINLVVRVLQPILATVIAYRLTDLIGDIFEGYAEKTKSTVDDQLVPLVRKTIKIIVVIIGIFYVVNSLGIDYTPLLAGASVGGLALALAAQDTMKNFFGSITIFTDKPFDVGDWIKFGPDEGTVEEVGVRSTRVRTFYNSLVSIPNGRISDMAIDNMGRRKYRRYFTNLILKFNTDPEKIKLFVEGMKEILLGMEKSRKDYYEINLNNFGQYGLEVLVYIFFETGTWTEELACKQEFIFKTLELAKKLGIEFAYPTQNIKLESTQGKIEGNNE